MKLSREFTKESGLTQKKMVKENLPVLILKLKTIAERQAKRNLKYCIILLSIPILFWLTRS
jgi:hypothetical protein